MNKHLMIKLFLLLTILLVSIQIHATKMYRYINPQGKVVVSSTLPPEVSQDGYEIINEMGIVIQTIAPRKTEAQLREDLLNKVKIEADERKIKEQEQLDTILKNSYTDISDIERARDNELIAKDRDIMLLKLNIRRLTRLLEDTQTRAARDERLGRDISEPMLAEVARFKKRIKDEGEEVVNVEEIKGNISERYSSSIIRFSELMAEDQLRRHRPGALASEDSKAVIYQCNNIIQCDRAWQASLLYASENSTTELAWANERTIMMRKPRKNDDISIILTRVDSRNGKDSSLVLEVRCNKTQQGEDLCSSEIVRSIEKSYIPYLK